MLVDCTDLLNKRHLVGKDKGWLRAYPADSGEALSVHDVRVYGTNPSGRGKIAVVSYGNGVVTSLQAREELSAELKEDVDVIDCMLLSEAPDGLKEEVRRCEERAPIPFCRITVPILTRRSSKCMTRSSSLTSARRDRTLSPECSRP